MNLTDLSAELEARAADPAPAAAMSRLTGVRTRIRTRRRRQAAAAAGLTAVCVVGVLLTPSLSQRHADRTPAPATTTSTADPLAFDRDLSGDPLLAAGVGVAGQRDLLIRFTPADSNLSFTDFCLIPDVATKTTGTAAVTATVTLNGHRISQADCDGGGDANGSHMTFADGIRMDPEFSRLWSVHPGQESILRMKVNPAKGHSDVSPKIRIGAAIYQLSGPRVISDGVTIKQQDTSDGHTYRLGGYLTGKASATHRRLTLAVPAGRYPVLVMSGDTNDPVSDQNLQATLLVDGKEQDSITGGGIEGDISLDDAGAHTIEVRLDPGLRGTMVLAYYVRTD